MPTDRHIIEVRNISKTYKLGDVQVPALREVSLDINDGDFIIITGRNGSGKSTLLRQLGLLDKPNEGTITLNGHEVTRMAEKKRSLIRLKHLGYIFQEYALIAELSAVENVMLPAMMLETTKACKPRAQELLEKVGLHNKLKYLPRQLSGGEQQKVAIARALINKPDVIFADEPTANLDSIAARDVLSVFKKLNESEHRTIVMITHEQDEISYANRIIKLADGKRV
ncbi:MAG: ABC transporter ATP-binding protein [Patescibacteria group bacterium]